nr:hypothetical protein L204_05007 [Cryptococcus depauperatus CBS 7855]
MFSQLSFLPQHQNNAHRHHSPSSSPSPRVLATDSLNDYDKRSANSFSSESIPEEDEEQDSKVGSAKVLDGQHASKAVNVRPPFMPPLREPGSPVEGIARPIPPSRLYSSHLVYTLSLLLVMR